LSAALNVIAGLDQRDKLAAGMQRTAAASSATDKDASSKDNAGKAAADTGISDASSSTAGNR